MILDSFRPDRKIAIVTCSDEGLNAAMVLAQAKADASVAYHSPGHGSEELMGPPGSMGRKEAFHATGLADPSVRTGMIYATFKSSSSIAILSKNAWAIRRSRTAEYVATGCDNAIAANRTSVFRLVGAMEEQRKCR